ncbi:Putative sugar-binding N-terminal domain-containing protein, partial [Streptomyces sp. IgraMP-1]
MPTLGAIADDFTGATDLATMLVSRGFRTLVAIGADAVDPEASAEADAVVVALKSRTAPVEEAVADSLAALIALRAAGCRRCYFKYCSTFDSTQRGNIGPVADALLEAVHADRTVVVPAFPATGRTVRDGLLYVHGEPLDRSPMRHHPLTPMTDASLARLLRPQTRHPVRHDPPGHRPRGRGGAARGRRRPRGERGAPRRGRRDRRRPAHRLRRHRTPRPGHRRRRPRPRPDRPRPGAARRHPASSPG